MKAGDGVATTQIQPDQVLIFEGTHGGEMQPVRVYIYHRSQSEEAQENTQW